MNTVRQSHRPLVAIFVAVFFAAVAAGCTGPSASEVADAGVTEPDAMGPCDASAIIYKISVDDEAVDLAEGATLPVTRGFQGFLFVRIGLKTPLVLPQSIKLKAHVEVPGEVDRVAVYATVQTEAVAGGYRTTDVPVFFNDTPLAELVGRTATVELWTQSPGCRLQGSASVTLGTGVYMNEDASFWDQDVMP